MLFNWAHGILVVAVSSGIYLPLNEYWLIDWLTHSLTHSLTDWLTDWLIDRALEVTSIRFKQKWEDNTKYNINFIQPIGANKVY